MGLRKFRILWQKKQGKEISATGLKVTNQVNVDCVVASINNFIRERKGIESDPNFILNPRFAIKHD